MNADDFWTLIESTRRGTKVDRRPQVLKIAKRLNDCTLKDIARFKRALNQNLSRAYTFDLMAAAFTVHSYVSDDVFLNFRAWLLLHGRRAFERALISPDSIVQLVTKRDVGAIHCGGLPDLAGRIWLERGASLKQYVKLAGYLKDPAIRQDWPETKEAFRSRYPVLYAALWNPQRIKAMQSL